jgi:hypothetical protein
MPVLIYTKPKLVAETSAYFVKHLFYGIISLLIAAAAFAVAKQNRRLACAGMLLMTMAELMTFAGSSIMTFTIAPPYSPDIQAFLDQNPGNYRIQGPNPNAAMMAGTYDIGGDDPSDLLRYERYYDYIRGIDFQKGVYLPPTSMWLINGLKILRCRYLFHSGQDDYTTIRDPLPQLLLIDKFRVMTNYREIFPILVNTNFSPDKEIILESPPNPAPQPSAEMGSVRLASSSSDTLTIEAETKSPCLLFVTDGYSKGWRAVALPGSSQVHYDVLPADYCLRAVPLAAGHHLLRMEYLPLGFRVGKIVSIIAWPLFAAMAVFVWRSKIPVQSHA